ncbi:hypothetical protein [Kineococcus radiotolerans]|uniref:Uncharacterized protein n=1 Tax=Kineococcus radiotolerans (strain ATCC BAA-149 / DSM 14245 / SRS30216) TaxID=266940 RepID=A6W8P5_KINRD|nr:hypothetical protein [Kineococcus radiotolerans]ABS03184.1 hypothetical protein Krad_1698 [Kineococcus radiotolerans SRS30216 = ATCC BAA-149]
MSALAQPKLYVKAISAGALAGLGAAGTALVDGVVTGQEWVGIAIAALAAGITVYNIPNGASPDPTTSTPDEPPHG